MKNQARATGPGYWLRFSTALLPQRRCFRYGAPSTTACLPFLNGVPAPSSPASLPLPRRRCFSYSHRDTRPLFSTEVNRLRANRTGLAADAVTTPSPPLRPLLLGSPLPYVPFDGNCQPALLLCIDGQSLQRRYCAHKLIARIYTPNSADPPPLSHVRVPARRIFFGPLFLVNFFLTFFN
jgi:hypothetical protein